MESKSVLVDMLDSFVCPLFLIGTIMETSALDARRSTSTTFCASCSCLAWQPFSGSVDWVSRTIWMYYAKSRSYATWFIFVWPSQKWCLLIKAKNTRWAGTTNMRSFFFIIKPTRCTNYTNLFWHETLHVSDSSSVQHQEFIHCTLSNGICHTGL
jgi:hypothetical protein